MSLGYSRGKLLTELQTIKSRFTCDTSNFYQNTVSYQNIMTMIVACVFTNELKHDGRKLGFLKKVKCGKTLQGLKHCKTDTRIYKIASNCNI